jgi:hypothetical protein
LEDARKQFDRLVALQPAHAALGHVQSESEHLSADIAQLGYIGAIAARQGDRLEALRIDRVLAQTKRRYLLGGHTSWRARIHTLLGDRDRSIELLRAAFGEGYPYSPSLHTDLAFEALRDYPPFQGLMKPKG